jgi:sulfoxide reductase heme-binding subunit YedZ
VHLTSNPVDWYAARAAGIVAYVLLTVVVVLGLALAGRAPGRRWRRWPMFAVEDVHRFGGLLVGSFIAIHVVAIAIDAYLPFSLSQLAVPLTASYRPIWTGLGIAAAELLLALAVTNHYRRRLPHRLWRGAHYANFAVWSAATLHGMGSGTDRTALWSIALYAVCVGAVASAAVLRFSTAHRLPTGRLRPQGALSVGAVAAVGVVALATGPLHVHHRPWNALRFSDALSGTIRQQTAITRAIVSMSGSAHGRQNVLVRADLLLSPNAVRSTNFQMEFLPSGAVCHGHVGHVQPFGFDARCRMPDGSAREVRARWRLTDGSALRGSLVAQP